MTPFQVHLISALLTVTLFVVLYAFYMLFTLDDSKPRPSVINEDRCCSHTARSYRNVRLGAEFTSAEGVCAVCSCVFEKRVIADPFMCAVINEVRAQEQATQGKATKNAK